MQTENKTKMVVGFMFNEKETEVLLIEKKKPAWQLNKFNGIGGKREAGEDSYKAMQREFKEEAGIADTKWTYVITMGGSDWEVDVWGSKSDEIFNAVSMEQEKVQMIPLSMLDDFELVDNLYWLIEMCRNKLNGGMDYTVANLVFPQSPSPSIDRELAGKIMLEVDSAHDELILGNCLAGINKLNNIRTLLKQ